MKIILLLITSLHSIQINAETIEGVDAMYLYQNAKEQLEKHCVKCGGSLLEFKKGVFQLEKVLENSHDEEFYLSAKELLGDVYGQLAFGFFNKKDIERVKYSKKQRDIYEKLEKSSTCLNPDLIFKLQSYKKNNDERLLALKPILKLESTLFKAKYYEGLMLIENGSIEEGLEALETAIVLAKFRDAHHSAFRLAEIMKEHGKMQFAYKIMKKKYDNMDEKGIDELLNKK